MYRDTSLREGDKDIDIERVHTKIFPSMYNNKCSDWNMEV